MAASISDIRLLLRVKSLPKSPRSHRVFIAGGTGYIGSALIPMLLEREHRLRVLVRPGPKSKLPAACEVVSGDALDANTYRQLIKPCDTFINLVGTPRPPRAKAEEFRTVDLVSAREAIHASMETGIKHFIYVSAPQPAPIMRAYVAVRAECEQLIQEHRPNATILRPWYVLGPGHRWPYVLHPFYRLFELLPFTRKAAQRLGLVTLDEMILALVQAVESPVQGTKIMQVPEIRAAELNFSREDSQKTA